jgi:hypothetical protein
LRYYWTLAMYLATATRNGGLRIAVRNKLVQASRTVVGRLGISNS